MKIATGLSAALLCSTLFAQDKASTIARSCTQKEHNGIIMWTRPVKDRAPRVNTCAIVYDGENKSNWYATIEGPSPADPVVFATREAAVAYVEAQPLPDGL